jgi:ATP-dependent Lhr-like helicase
MEGPDSVRGIIEQLEGFEAPATAWEGEILPARLVEYDPAWLDALCLAGEVVWARLTPPIRTQSDAIQEKARGAAPVRNTPIALLRRKNFAMWSSIFPQSSANGDLDFSSTTRVVYEYLQNRGASFFTDVVDGTRLLRSQVEESLAELVASGVVVSDSFTGLRALLTPGSRKTQAAARRKHRQPVYDMASAGRWSIINRVEQVTTNSSSRFSTGPNPETTDQVARILLKRYEKESRYRGVCF